MKSCMSCRNKALTKAKFCPRCGGQQFEPVYEAPVTIKCPCLNGPCENQISVDDDFCSECGCKVDHSWFKGTDVPHTLIDKADDLKECRPNQDTAGIDTKDTSSDLSAQGKKIAKSDQGLYILYNFVKYINYNALEIFSNLANSLLVISD